MFVDLIVLMVFGWYVEVVGDVFSIVLNKSSFSHGNNGLDSSLWILGWITLQNG